MKARVGKLVLICLGLGLPKIASAQTAVKIGTEAVDDFTGCPWGSLSNDKANVNGLYNGMTTTGGISWTQGTHFQDASVYDTDFIDREKDSLGRDDANFDRPLYGITMYSGHGDVNQWGGTCSTSSQCNSPN